VQGNAPCGQCSSLQDCDTRLPNGWQGGLKKKETIDRNRFHIA